LIFSGIIQYFAVDKKKDKKDKKEKDEAHKSDSDDDIDAVEGGLIQTSILTNMLFPLHAAFGSLTGSNETEFQIRERHATRKELQQAFNIPESEEIITYWSCALKKKKLLFQGKLYLSSSNLYFYANILGKIVQKQFPLGHIVSVDKENTAKVIPNAIQIRLFNGKKFFFSSFVNRESCHVELEAELKKFLKEKNRNDSLTKAQRGIMD